MIKAIRIHAQNFDDCARLCAYETIVHTNQTVGSHYEDSRKNYLDIAGQLDRFKIDSFQQNNLLGNIVVTEAGHTQQMMGVMASRFNEVSATMMKEIKETIVKETLVNFLSSSNMMDFRTQDGQFRL